MSILVRNSSSTTRTATTLVLRIGHGLETPQTPNRSLISPDRSARGLRLEATGGSPLPQGWRVFCGAPALGAADSSRWSRPQGVLAGETRSDARRDARSVSSLAVRSAFRYLRQVTGDAEVFDPPRRFRPTKSWLMPKTGGMLFFDPNLSLIQFWRPVRATQRNRRERRRLRRFAYTLRRVSDFFV